MKVFSVLLYAATLARASSEEVLQAPPLDRRLRRGATKREPFELEEDVAFFAGMMRRMQMSIPPTRRPPTPPATPFPTAAPDLTEEGIEPAVASIKRGDWNGGREPSSSRRWRRSSSSWRSYGRRRYDSEEDSKSGKADAKSSKRDDWNGGRKRSSSGRWHRSSSRRWHRSSSSKKKKLEGAGEDAAVEPPVAIASGPTDELSEKLRAAEEAMMLAMSLLGEAKSMERSMNVALMECSDRPPRADAPESAYGYGGWGYSGSGSPSSKAEKPSDDYYGGGGYGGYGSWTSSKSSSKSDKWATSAKSAKWEKSDGGGGWGYYGGGGYGYGGYGGYDSSRTTWSSSKSSGKSDKWAKSAKWGKSSNSGSPDPWVGGGGWGPPAEDDDDDYYYGGGGGGGYGSWSSSKGGKSGGYEDDDPWVGGGGWGPPSWGSDDDGWGYSKDEPSSDSSSSSTKTSKSKAFKSKTSNSKDDSSSSAKGGKVFKTKTSKAHHVIFTGFIENGSMSLDFEEMSLMSFEMNVEDQLPFGRRE